MDTRKRKERSPRELPLGVSIMTLQSVVGATIVAIVQGHRPDKEKIVMIPRRPHKI
jgi:hypothetical protein